MNIKDFADLREHEISRKLHVKPPVNFPKRDYEMKANFIEYLSPCPFCNEQEVIYIREAYDGKFWVECGHCKVGFGNPVNGAFDEPEEVMYAWNYRPNETQTKIPNKCRRCRSSEHVEERNIPYTGYYVICAKCGDETATSIKDMGGWFALQEWNELNSY